MEKLINLMNEYVILPGHENYIFTEEDVVKCINEFGGVEELLNFINKFIFVSEYKVDYSELKDSFIID